MSKKKSRPKPRKKSHPKSNLSKAQKVSISIREEDLLFHALSLQSIRHRQGR